MFDIGFTELLVIAIVALVVLGPERLPKAARFAGLWVRRARNQWDSVKQELERELQAEEIKKHMQDVRQGMQETEHALRASGEAVRRQAASAQHEAQVLADEATTDRAPVTAPATSDIPATPAVSASPLPEPARSPAASPDPVHPAGSADSDEGLRR